MKNTRSVAGEDLRKYVVEALEERARNLPVSPPVLGPGYPYLDNGPLSAKVSAELGPPEQSVLEIKRRLKRFLYPYELGTKQPKTFYQHARSCGVLQSLITPPLLWNIRHFWWLERDEFYQAKLRVTKRSEYALPLSFHKALVVVLTAHLRAIDKLFEKHTVKRKKGTAVWFERFGDYRSAVLKQLLNEAAIYYPRVQLFQYWSPEPATEDWMIFQKVEAEVELLEAVESTLRKQGVQSQKFASQLTALFCTSRENIKENQLSPTPQTIRLNRQWLKQRLKIGLSKKAKTQP